MVKIVRLIERALLNSVYADYGIYASHVTFASYEHGGSLRIEFERC